MASEEESIAVFLMTATKELLYNIVFSRQIERGEDINDTLLSEEFKRRVGYEPMDFFGLGNITTGNIDCLEFLRHSAGFMQEEERVSIDLDDDCNVFKDYNSRFLSTTISVAEYREILLVRACKLIAHRRISEDCNGNTPLHLVTAMPGIVNDKPTLLGYLLKAGLDPLRVNNQGINLLHIIAGRLKAEVDEKGDIYFGSQNVNPESWEVNHRKILLHLISQELSPEQLAALMRRPGRNGNTVMHEWVLSTSNSLWEQAFDFVVKEIEIASTLLLNFNGNLWFQNQSGLFPLHLASNSTVFKFLLQNGAVCRARNGQDETAFMFILKYLVTLAFVNTLAFKEIEVYLFKANINLEQCLQEAVIVLGHLLTTVSETTKLQKTLWIPDIEDVSPLEIVLVSIRSSSYVDISRSPSDFSNLRNLRDYLVALLEHILKAATPNNVKRANKKGESAIHVLLDMSSKDDTNTINDGSVILQSLQVLLQNGADVDAVDENGQTVMDIVRKNAEKMRSFSKKCADILQQQAQLSARVECNTGHESVQAMSALTVGKVTRKLRSCPKYHTDTALQLTKDKTNVTTVEKYRYLNQTPIGSGAFSSIYVAIKDEHVDKKSATIDCRAIALKRLEKGKINPDEIKREVQALLSMSTQCENILNCYESFEDEFFHYLSLDLMDGDLQQFVGNATAKSMMQQSQGSRAKAAQDIINGLVYLHEHDYLHRDLKPGNILYTIEPSLHFKIGDFGLAKNVSSSSTMASTKGAGGAAMAPGTRCWMAPELVSLRSRKHTKESDVFALGLVLHFLLTYGRHPFVTAEEPTHVTEKKIEDMSFTIYGALPSEDSSFLEQILAKDPKRRPPVKYLAQHPFLWSEKKKIEFLKAIGDQREAASPNSYPNSRLEKTLQKTGIATQFEHRSWDSYFPELYSEATRVWRQKKYRTNSVLDLARFIRNAYAHKEERSPKLKLQLHNNIFLTEFPSLVLEVFGVVQMMGYHEERGNISQVLQMT